MSDNQTARLDEDNVKTEPAMVETKCQSEPQLQNTDWDRHIRTKLPQLPQLQNTNNPNHQSLHQRQQEMENNPTDLEHLYPQFCLIKEGGCDGFKETSRNVELFFIKVSENNLPDELCCYVDKKWPKNQTQF